MILSLATRLYRGSLAILPPEFRRRFQEEMIRDFTLAAEASRTRRGTWGVVASLGVALADVAITAPREWRRERQQEKGRRIPMSTWAREIWMAGRALSRRPGFSMVILLTLALGIAANVAIFTVVNAVLLRPLPFPESDRILTIDHHAPGIGLPELRNSGATVHFYGENARTLEAVAMVSTGQRNLTGSDVPARVAIAWVSDPFFRVLAVAPVLGRAFTEADGLPDGPPVAILMHDTWVARFGSDPTMVGRSIQLNGLTTDVIGVMPAGFQYPSVETAMLMPRAITADAPFGEFGFLGIARLGDGMTLEDARREILQLQPRLQELAADDVDGQSFFEAAGWSVTTTSLRDRLVDPIRATLSILLVTVALVFVIAWANVANLFMARAEGRQREVAVRAAMGAGRGRLAVMFLSEALVLGLTAGIIGMAIARAGVQALIRYGPQEIPRLHEIEMHGAVLAFGIALSLVAGLACGILPVVRHLGQSFARVLRDGGRGATDGARRHGARNALVIGQLAMAMVLLIGSGLMVQSYRRLRAVDPGLDPQDVTAVTISVGNVTDSARARFYQGVVEALGQLPGVTAAGATNALPLTGDAMTGGSFSLSEEPTEEGGVPPVAMRTAVTPGFFESLRIQLREGQPLTSESLIGPKLAWVNETFARSFLPNGALGQGFRVGDEEVEWTIAGVVGDVRHFGLAEPIQPMMYFPIREDVEAAVNLQAAVLAMRSSRGPGELAEEVRRVVATLDGSVPVTTVRSMDDVMSASTARESFTMVLLAISAAVAFLLGAVGVYGVNSYVVSQRTREIGVRMALGAHPERVQGMVVRQGITVATLGILLGIGVALALTRLMTALLFQVSATDPLTFTLVPLILAGVSALACWIPARRASLVDPVRALGAE